ncbi:hypothetical protein GJAV_G00085400 [Gymnothorax javanicus]|nr:hypothetical protein GJAV_G00085400 [Gymnothorax javanicus]
MVRVCVFPSCCNKMTSWTTFSFHRLPLRNLELLKLWLVALKIDPNTPVEALRRADHRVCSAHFATEDFFPARPQKEGRKVQRLNLRKNAIPMAAADTMEGQNPLTERTGKEIRREEEKKEEAMQDKEPQNARRVKEEQTCEADDVSVVIIPGLTDDGQTETERRAMLPQLVTGGFIKPEPEQCEIDRHGDNSRTSAMTEEEEEQPIVRILKQEAEDMAWETSSHWDTQGQETGNGDDSFLQTKSIKAEPERCEIGCHGATEEEGPIVRTLKREAEDMTWEMSSHSDSQEQETGKGDDSSLLVVVKDSRPVKLLRCPCSCETGSAPCEHVAAWLDRMSHTSQVEVVVVPPADSFSEAVRTSYKPGEMADKSRRPSDRMVVVSSRPRERKMEECWRSSLWGGDIGDPLDLSARLVEVYSSFSSDEAPLISTMGISTEAPLVDSAVGKVPFGSVLSYQLPAERPLRTLLHADAPPRPLLPLEGYRLEPTELSCELTERQQLNLISLAMSLGAARETEAATRGWDSSLERHRAEKQRIDSSWFLEVCRVRGQKSAQNLAERMMNCCQQASEAKTTLELRQVAVEGHCLELEVNHYPCGVLVHPDIPWMVSSPDGLIYDPGAQPTFGLLEMECTSVSSYTDCSCIEVQDGTPVLKPTHPYYWRIQGHLLVSGLEWCDFLLYSREDMLIQRIRRDVAVIKEIRAKVDHFFFKAYLQKTSLLSLN